MFNKISPLFTLILFTFTLTIQAQVILIDPGHGGEDCGAKGKITEGKEQKELCEKDLALSISKKIHAKLEKDFKAYLTRSVDRDVSLQERADLAEKIKADLFISVHLNASTHHSSHGYETFYLSNHKDAAVKKVEEIENQNVKGEDLIVNQILIDLVIDRTAPQSRELARSIHRRINGDVQKRFRLVNRGIKPALFYVLALSKRPSILLEAGFMSNDKEMNKILDEDFQERYANAVALGVKDYFAKKPSISLF